MSITQSATRRQPKATNYFAMKISPLARHSTQNTAKIVGQKRLQSLYSLQVQQPRTQVTSSPLLGRTEWLDDDYREAYMEAAIEQGVAWQIKLNRTARGMSQEALARAIGTQQSAVSRMEDPSYGAHSLETLVQVARAFDCALLVKFCSYSQLAHESENLSAAAQYASPFSEERGLINGQEI